MKKINNKGFAISTLLYGLLLVAFLVISLLMSVMSNNRKNTSTLIRKIEDELNRYSQTATTITSTDGPQEFVVPYGKAGWYKIELWGAAGYGVNEAEQKEEHRGSYTSGIIYLEENEHLYFYIGTLGTTSTTNIHNIDYAKGGGATDVRTVGGVWSSSLDSRIMVAAGGGGDSSSEQGTGFGGHYKQNNDGGSYISGMAGESAKAKRFLNATMFSNVTSTSGKAKIEMISSTDKETPPQKRTMALGNIKAVVDCISVSGTSLDNHWSEIQIFDKNGKNLALKTNGASAKFDSETTVKNGLGTDVDEIIDGKFDTSAISLTPAEGKKCVAVNLNSATNVDVEDITIFHNVQPGTADTKKTGDIYVQKADGSWQQVRNWVSEEYSPDETKIGIRISDRNFHLEYSNDIPTGNYYIQSSTSNNRVITVEKGAGELKLFTGNNTDRWSVQKRSSGAYTIIDGENLKALQPVDGGQEVGELINNTTEYKEDLNYWDEWEITSLENGYQTIKTKSGGNLCLAVGIPSNRRNESAQLQLETCNTTARNQWFRFINADY